MRRIFIGDVHGCSEPLERLLDAVEFRPGTDVLYQVGDLVNKGPDSIGVLRRMVDLDAQCVIGNHDLYWLAHDRIDDPTLADWLRSQPVVRVLDDVIMVHAALHPHWTVEDLATLDDADRDFAVNARYCTADGERPTSDWPPPEDPYRPWDEFYEGEHTVVFGHWARRGFERTDSTIALDSGCVYGNELTAWVAEEDRVVQVPREP